MDYPKECERLWSDWTARRNSDLCTPEEMPEMPIPKNGDTWGPWRFSTSRGIPSLDFGRYEIQLDRILSPVDTYLESRGIMNWIRHLNTKGWGAESMGRFIDAVLTIERHGYMLGKKHIQLRRADQPIRIPDSPHAVQ